MADLIKIYEENPNEREIEKVVDVLKKGGLIIYPTDTVYGLGCDITNMKAMEKVAKIKGLKLAKANFSLLVELVCAYLKQQKKDLVWIESPSHTYHYERLKKLSASFTNQ